MEGVGRERGEEREERGGEGGEMDEGEEGRGEKERGNQPTLTSWLSANILHAYPRINDGHAPLLDHI